MAEGLFNVFFRVFVGFNGIVVLALGFMYVLAVIGSYSELLMILAVLPLLFGMCVAVVFLFEWVNDV